MIASLTHDPYLQVVFGALLSMGLATGIHRSDLYETPKLCCHLANLAMAMSVAWQCATKLH